MSGSLGQDEEQVISDGAGGAIVVWKGGGASFDIYAQRISGAGVIQWGPAGVPLCSAIGNQDHPVLTSDGAGGTIVAWNDSRFASPGPIIEIFAQRVSGSGIPLWQTDGVALSSGSGYRGLRQIIADGAGGAITAWQAEDRTNPDAPTDIYAQRVDAQGTPVWGTHQLAVCLASGNQLAPVLASDGSGGAIIAWQDGRNGVDDDLYGQHVDASGAPQWTPNGLGICTLPGHQDVNRILSDGAGGAVVLWTDGRSDSDQVYAQRIDGAGVGQWTPNGVGLFSVNRTQTDPCIAPDGGGGAFVAWLDYRNGDRQLYGQRLSLGGTQEWGPGGIALSTTPGPRYSPRIASDGMNGAVVVWVDARHSATRIYAQGVQPDGLGGEPVASAPPPATPAALDLAPAGSNPSRANGFRVRFSLTGAEPASLEVVDVSGRRISARSVGSFGAGTHTLELADEAQIKPGLYFVRLRQGERVRMIRLAKIE
jgi:hypothetical protein